MQAPWAWFWSRRCSNDARISIWKASKDRGEQGQARRWKKSLGSRPIGPTRSDTIPTTDVGMALKSLGGVGVAESKVVGREGCLVVVQLLDW